MSTATAEDHQKHVRAFKMVLIALLVGTVVTVAASYLPVGHVGHVLVALLIATVKASLVALIFMHLKAERMFLYSILVLSAAFFAVLLLIPVFTEVESVGTDTQRIVAAHDDHGGDHATDGH